MRLLVAVLGTVWALGNVGVGYLFLAAGVAAKTAHKGPGVQALLVVAGLVVLVFAALLLAQGLTLARSRRPG